MTINERFKQVRKEAKMSQQDFGGCIGVSRDVIANIECGRIEPKGIHVISTCKVFSVNKSWLMYGAGDMKTPLTAEEEASTLLAKVQISALEGSQEAKFKQRFASRILAMSDDDCRTFLRILADLGFSEK